MSAPSRNTAAIGTTAAAAPFGTFRSPLRSTVAVMQKARAVFPVKTAGQLADITGYSKRACEAWLAGEAKIPTDALASLLHSEYGLEFLVAVMEESRPSWWRWLLRLGVAASVMRRRAADRRLLERTMSADRELADAIARAEIALSVSDEEFHRPYLDALGEAMGASRGAVAGAARTKRP